MDGFPHILWGAAATLLVHGLLWVGAWAVSASSSSLGLGDRLLVAFSVAVFQAVGITLGAAAFGLMNPVAVGATSVVVSSAFIALRMRRSGAFTGGFLEVSQRLASKAKEVWASEPWTFIVLAPGLVFFALLFIPAVSSPPMGYDPLNYHLTIAASAIQSGTFPILFFPPYFNLYAWFPANGAVFAIWTILWTGCDLGLALVNVPFLLALAASIYLLARDLGLPRLPSATLTSAFLTVPMMAMLATEAYVEVPLWAMFFAALRFAVLSARNLARETDSPRHLTFLVVSGLCGVMVGTKTVGLFLSLIVIGVHAIVAFRLDWFRIRSLLFRAASILAGVTLFGSYFYIRNYIASGNPIYPLSLRLFGHEVFSGHLDSDRLWGTTLAAHFDYLWSSGKLLKAVFGEVFSPNSSWGLGPTGFAAIVLGLPAGVRSLLMTRDRVATAFLLSGILVGVAWFFMPYSGKFLFSNVRFALPAVFLIGLVGARAFSSHPIVFSALVLALQAASFFFTNVFVSPSSGVALVVGVALVWVALKARLYALSRLTSRVRWLVSIFGAAGLAAFVLLRWHDARERDRILIYREATEPYRLQVAEYADCLAAVERHLPNGRLAVAMEPFRRGFLYPLFGSHLQREVLYVHNGPEDSRLHPDFPYGNPRKNPDLESWLRHLAQASPDALLVFLDPVENEIPIESPWALSRPDIFRAVFASPRCELYLLDKRGLTE